MSTAGLFRDAPIGRKLMLIGLLTTALALFSVSLILVARGWVDWRDKTLMEMENYAALIGANAAPSIIFGDYDAANEVLQTLGKNSDIVDVVLYDKDGKVFARYHASTHLDSGIPFVASGSYSFTFDKLVVTKPVMLKGEAWGSVYLESDLHGFYAAVARQAVLTFITAAGVFLLTLFLFSRLQKAIVDPLANLSGVMRRVSTQQDYAVRVPVQGRDEVGVLAGTFNDMLAQIQKRDEALELHKAHLEEEVAQRTGELQENNRLLEHELVERKLAEKALRRANVELGLFRTLVDNSSDGLYVIEPETMRILDVNAQACRVLGYSRDELLSMSVFDIDPVFTEEARQQAVERLQESGANRFESIHRRKDGVTYPVEISSGYILLDKPYILSTVRDIAERRRAEAERRRLSEAVEQSLEAIMLTDVGHVIIYANPAFTRLFGYSSEDVVGHPVDMLALADGYGPTPLQAMAIALDQGAYSGETRCRSKGGSSVPVLLNVAAVRDDRNEISGYVGAMTDLSELKRAEMEARQRMVELTRANTELTELNAKLAQVQVQLMQSEKMASIGMLAAGVAHEINNPIGYIRSNLGALGNYIGDFQTLLDAYDKVERSMPDRSASFSGVKELKKDMDIAYVREDVMSLLRESHEGVERVTKIVQDLKDFSRVETEEKWASENIHHGIDSTLNVIWNELKYKCEVVREYGDLPEVECLLSQLNQVFMNLLVNAAQSIEESGTITIRTGREGEQVWVEIGDTGQGIAPEDIPHLFDPFFTTKPVGKGTGLGLSVSYNIVEKHHGKIEVHSEVGKGSTFRVWLPIRQTKESA